MRIVFFRVQLAEQNALLRRIAEALERLAPALPDMPPPRKSDLSDLRIVDHQEQRQLQELEAELARAWNVVPGSEAYLKARAAYEDEMRAGQGGQEAVDELPWNWVGKQR